MEAYNISEYNQFVTEIERCGEHRIIVSVEVSQYCVMIKSNNKIGFGVEAKQISFLILLNQ